MRVDGQIRVRIDGLADCRDDFDVEGDVAVADGAVVRITLRRPGVDVELDGIEAARLNPLCRGCPGGWILFVVGGVAIVVDADRVAEGAAQQLPDRYSQGLSGDVPQGHFDAADRAHDRSL